MIERSSIPPANRGQAKLARYWHRLLGPVNDG